MEKIAQR